MRKPRGKEMKRYLLSVTALVVVLLLAVIVYTTIDSIRRINREMDKEKDRVNAQMVGFFTDAFQAMSTTGQDQAVMGKVFKEELVGSTDMDKQMVLLGFLTEMERAQFNADYLVYVSNGNVVSQSVKPGLEISSFPTSMPGDGDMTYEILDELGGSSGYFISMYIESPLAGFGEEFMNFAVDQTDQMSALEQEYSDEKSDLIMKQIVTGVIILIIGGLISAFGVLYFTRRDITGPIEEINLISDQIMDGSFEGDVEVDQDSDFASLQALLSSGKKILDKMNELDN